jgi:hypothetical protein
MDDDDDVSPGDVDKHLNKGEKDEKVRRIAKNKR